MIEMKAGELGLRSFKGRPKLSEEVASQLRQLIQGGNLRPGAQLPTENAMIEQFGVSRTVVREAIAALSADGLVNSRQGRGVFVADDLTRQPFRLGDSELNEHDHILQIMELRLSLEVESAGLAAQRRTLQDLREIEDAFERMVEAQSRGQEGAEQDFAFHLRIAEATQNTYIAKFIRYLGPFIIPRPARRRVTGQERQDYLDGLTREHAKIRDAIAEQDEAAASEAMRTHLSRGLALNRSLLQS